MTTPAPHIQVLVFDGCPHADPALALARSVGERLGPGITVERVEVDSEERAAALGFLGSPSIRVNGEDVEGRTTSHGALCCRTYQDGSGVPSEWLVEAAVLRAKQPRGVLFLCVANSARSQLAEGIARALAPAGVRAWSAGSAPTRVRPEAIAVLAEIGIDISGQRSKHVSEIPPAEVDTVITLCDGEACPVFLGQATRLHWGLVDPAAATGSDDERRAAFRATRDELWRRLAQLFASPAATPRDARAADERRGGAMNPDHHDDVRTAVRERYGQVARDGGGGCGCSATGCCAPVPAASLQLGYSPDDLQRVPEGANLGLGCGNPQAIAELKPGEVVLDLGAGGGFDCFLAASQVGAAGHVIGVDMTPDMVTRARDNARRAGLRNVEFRLGEIEHLPVADQSVDVILSNCVINLSPDKAAVFADAFRVLRPGGRLAISDVVATAPLPDAIRHSIEATTGCIAGAMLLDDLRALLERTGFVDVRIDIDAHSKDFIRDWLPGSGAEQVVASARIQATRPR